MNPGDLGAPAFACVTALGAISGAVSFLVFRRWTNHEILRLTVNRIVAHLFEIRLFADEPGLVLRAQWDLIIENLRILRQFLLPSLILLLPFTLLFVVMDLFFGHAPLRPGDSTLVTVQLKGEHTSAQLRAPAGIKVDEPPVYSQADRQLVWQVHAESPTNGELRVIIDGTAFAKHIVAGDGFAFVSLRQGESSAMVDSIAISYPRATIFHANWAWWFALASVTGALIGAMKPQSRFVLLLVLFSLSCTRTHHPASLPKVIVLGVDGMDPAFVERHWDALPNLRSLRDTGYFGRLRTTSPPQSPVAWSTFITGLDPDQHGIYDFVHREPTTLSLFSSMSKTDGPQHVLPLGPYLLPLSSSRVYLLRRGTPFWRTLTEHGIPAIVQRMPINYPPEASGKNLSGMGTPDLLGTLGTFTFFTDDPVEQTRAVSGGRIVKAQVRNGRAELVIEGPPNPLRQNHAPTSVTITVDIDPSNDVARLKLGDNAVVIHQAEWSAWLPAEFSLIPHVSSVRGMVRVFAKQLHPALEIYVSPINLDPSAPALPIASPTDWSTLMENELGPYSTLGIPEDTSALRQEVLTLPQFREQAQLVFSEEAKILNFSLRQFKSGFLFFYFSSVDQNSHVLWGKHEDELLKVYREVDECVGTVRREQPNAELIILSDHGFTTFDRAVHLNTWLSQHGFLTVRGSPGTDAGLENVDWSKTKAYAVGLNGLYLNLKGRERLGTVSAGLQALGLLSTLRDQLLAWRDPLNGKAVIDTFTVTDPPPQSRIAAPDLIVGYAAGYRASWQTALGQIPLELIEDNNDAWIGDHCVNPAAVPGVLFSSKPIRPHDPGLKDVTALILSRFGLATSDTQK